MNRALLSPPFFVSARLLARLLGGRRCRRRASPPERGQPLPEVVALGQLGQILLFCCCRRRFLLALEHLQQPVTRLDVFGVAVGGLAQ